VIPEAVEESPVAGKKRDRSSPPSKSRHIRQRSSIASTSSLATIKSWVKPSPRGLVGAGSSGTTPSKVEVGGSLAVAPTFKKLPKLKASDMLSRQVVPGVGPVPQLAPSSTLPPPVGAGHQTPPAPVLPPPADAGHQAVDDNEWRPRIKPPLRPSTTCLFCKASLLVLASG